MDRAQACIPSIFVLALVGVALAGCGSGCSGSDCLKGSGTVVTQSRPVENITAIKLDSIGSLVVEQTGTDSLTVETDDNLQSIVTSVVKNGALTLADSGCRNCLPTKIAFKMTVKNLLALNLTSVGSVEVSKFDGPALSIDQSGTGSLKLSGRVDNLKIASSGTGLCDASGLTAKSATVVLSGTGVVRVNATGTLDAKMSGVGKILYAGAPELTQSVSGIGTIQPDTN